MTETPEVLHVVFCNDDGTPTTTAPFVTRVATVTHGDDLRGTNPVAVLHGRMCNRNRKPGCQWCTGLRDRIRSRTIR
jgi:hypothetical protein